MTKNVNFVSHKKSKQIVDGKPKLPLASSLAEGEIAINYAKDVETLSIKNESGTVVTFSSDNYYTEQKLGSGFTGANSAKTVTEAFDTLVGSGFTSSSITDVIIENEEITSAALTDLDDRKLDASAYTPTDLSNYYQKSETSGKTELSNALTQKLNKSDFNTYSGAVNTTINSKAAQSDLNTLSGTVTSHTADTTVHVTQAEKEKIDSIPSAFGTMAFEDKDSYSSATEVNTALGNKVDKVSGKGLSTNDYTTDEKNKLSGIASGAEVNVQADWTETATTADSYIKNKPTLGTAAAKGVSNGISNTDNLIESKHIYSGVGVTVSYDSSTHHIQLKSTSGNVLSSFDATDFIKDGMVESVTLESKSGTTYLVITWNTASGKTKTELNIGDIFEADNYYTKNDLTATTGYATVTKANSANTASTVALTGVTGADDLKAIEALTGTSGLLKKTATNTWTLDTTDYSNKNAFGKIKINAESTTIDSDTTNDTLTISGGSFVTLTSDATNDKFTIGVSTGTSSSTLSRGDHNHDSAYQAKGSYLSATTKYAGSSETGGAATSANKLNTNAGNATTPVYFSGGVPTALSYTIAKSVPSNAVFTDTDTKVTAVGNHYTPSATSADTKSATASSTSELNWGSAVVTGVTLSGDAKGHITSVTVASGKLKTPVTGVTLASGTNNGTVKLTVNGSATDNIAVKGLSSMAYQATSSYSSATEVNTALSGKSNTGHTHDDRYYTESELTGSSTTVVVAKASSATTAASAGSVAWGNVSGKPGSFTPSAHDQASSTITAMTGYAIASASGAVATNDTLNAAVGKLEKRIALLEAALGGMKLVKLTQAQYDALPTKDSNTLYVISD